MTFPVEPVYLALVWVKSRLGLYIGGRGFGRLSSKTASQGQLGPYTASKASAAAFLMLISAKCEGSKSAADAAAFQAYSFEAIK